MKNSRSRKVYRLRTVGLVTQSPLRRMMRNCNEQGEWPLRLIHRVRPFVNFPHMF